MIVPSVWVQSRAPGFEEKSLVVIGFEINDFDVFKAFLLCSSIRVLNDLSFWPTYTKLSCVQLILYTMPDFWRSESSSSLGCGKKAVDG